MIDIYNIKEKLKNIENYNIENSKGCEDCPINISGSYSEGVQGGGSRHCLKYGEISSWCNRGGGLDNDIDRGDGTHRLPNCEINLGEMKKEYTKQAEHSLDIAITKRIKELEEFERLKGLL
jgi:hypothetical protein